MSDDSSETLLEFPCEFPIKAIGHQSDDLVDIVYIIVQTHAPDIKKTAVTTRTSKNEKYLAITITVPATSKAQLDAIYIDLSASEHIVMTL